MKNIKHSLAVFGIFVATGLASLPAFAEDISSNYNGYPQWTRIINPEVNVPAKQYPGIRFNNGDTVYIKAGGCVQRGGDGLTWKRYVNPTGKNSDRLYHGQILIPGVMNSLTNFSQYIIDNPLDSPQTNLNPWAGPFVVQDSGNTFPVKYLTLGYTDNEYKDNGYWGHDNGTNNQCLDVYGAYVDIWISR